MSAPEFGWLSKYSGKGDLYGDFYYPVGENNAVELTFFESDAFFNDVIHSFTVEKGNGVHTLKYGNDEFVGVRSTVMPDRSSGKDRREAGAHLLKEGEGHEDTVSFLDSDRTDYYSFRSRPASILFLREDSAVRLETSADFLSGKAHDSLGRYIISESESGFEKIRVTADPGASRQRYAILAFSGQPHKKSWWINCCGTRL